LGPATRARKSSVSFGACPVTGPFAFISVHLRLKTFLTGGVAVGQSAPRSSSDTCDEAKQFEPQMNANGSVPNRPSERILGFALAKWRVTWER